MSITYNALINGNINPIDLVKLIQGNYGGDHYSVHFTNVDGFYQIHFNENYSEAVKAMPPWQRSRYAVRRVMSVFVDGACKCDYEHVTDSPMTYVSLGHSGEAVEIINSLIYSQGGYIKDEAATDGTSEDFVRLPLRDLNTVKGMQSTTV